MRLRVSHFCLAGLVIWLSGCGQDYYARGLLRHSRLLGQTRLALMGQEDKLVERGQVDAHLRIEVADGAALDVCVGIKGSGTFFLL